MSSITPINNVNQAKLIPVSKTTISKPKDKKSYTDRKNLLFGTLAALAVATTASGIIYKAKKGKKTSTEEIKNTTKSVIKQFKEIKNGKAYNVDGELFSGTVERVSVSGNRLATTYKDGLVAQREFKPIEGNIELVTKKYNYNDGYKDVFKTTKLRDGNETHSFHSTYKFPKYPELEPHFAMEDFLNCWHGQQIKKPRSASGRLGPNGSKTTYRYDGGVVVEHVSDKTAKNTTLTINYKPICLIQRENDGKTIWTSNENGLFFNKDNKFEYKKEVTLLPSGKRKILLKRSNGTTTVITIDKNDKILTRLSFDANGNEILS